MVSEGYELLSLFMRYIFIGLGVLILLRAYRWMRKDSRTYKRQMRALPDAGLVGEVVDLQSGKSQPLPREGLMGSSHNCDIRVKGPGVVRRHARFAFEEGKGLKITPIRGLVFLAGVELRSSAHALHGTLLQLGDAQLKVRLFAGLNVPHPSQFQMDLPETDLDEEDTPWDSSEFSGAYVPPFAPIQEGEIYAPAQPSFVPVQQENDHPIMEQNVNVAYGQSLAWQNVGSDPENNQYSQPNGPYAAYPQEMWQNPSQMPMQPQANMGMQDEEAGEDEALPYQSPVVRRRRRSRL